MGQKLLLLLDSDMTRDVKRLFSLWRWTVILSHAVRWFPTVCGCHTSRGEFWVRRALGQESHQDICECYSDIPACQNRCEAYSNTITHGEGHTGSLYVSLFPHISFTASMSAQKCCTKKKKSWGSISSSYYWTSRWISSFILMSRSQTSGCTATP